MLLVHASVASLHRQISRGSTREECVLANAHGSCEVRLRGISKSRTWLDVIVLVDLLIPRRDGLRKAIRRCRERTLYSGDLHRSTTVVSADDPVGLRSNVRGILGEHPGCMQSTLWLVICQQSRASDALSSATEGSARPHLEGVLTEAAADCRLQGIATKLQSASMAMLTVDQDAESCRIRPQTQA